MSLSFTKHAVHVEENDRYLIDVVENLCNEFNSKAFFYLQEKFIKDGDTNSNFGRNLIHSFRAGRKVQLSYKDFLNENRRPKSK